MQYRKKVRNTSTPSQIETSTSTESEVAWMAINKEPVPRGEISEQKMRWFGELSQKSHLLIEGTKPFLDF